MIWLVVAVVLYLVMQAAQSVKATVNSVTGGGQSALGQVSAGAFTSLLNWISSPSGRSSAGGGTQTTVPGQIGTSVYGTPLYGANYGAWGTSGSMIDPTALVPPGQMVPGDSTRFW